MELPAAFGGVVTITSFLSGCIAMLALAAVAALVTAGIEIALRRIERRR